MHNIQVNDVKAIIPNNALFMKKLEKYKIALQAKFLKFKVKHFVEIPTIRHDKAVPPLLDCLKSSSPLNVSPPWLLKFSSCPPAWLMTQKSFPPWSQGGEGGEDSMMLCSHCPINDSSGCLHITVYIALMLQASWRTAEGN